MHRISAYILAFNEAEKIADAVSSVLWADEIVVADPAAPTARPRSRKAWELGSCRSLSMDSATCAIAPSRNAGTSGYSASILTSAARLRSATRFFRSCRPRLPHDAYLVPRRNYMMGRWIKGSGWYPNFRQPQLFRKGAMRYDNDPVHEGYELLTQQPLGRLQSAIWQIPFRNLAEIISKMNRYSSLGVQKLSGKRVSMAGAVGHGIWAFHQALPAQARLSRRLGGFRHRAGKFRRHILPLRQALRGHAGMGAAGEPSVAAAGCLPLRHPRGLRRQRIENNGDVLAQYALSASRSSP